MRLLTSAAGTALALAASAPASASPSDFYACDGYAAPTKKVDGMSKGTWIFGLASRSEDIRRNQTTFGAAAISSCDSALADQLLLPQYWLRRSHLLQAKATHQIEVGNIDGALASLSASDAAAPAADPFFERSVMMGNHALRAMAYYKQGKKDAALAELAIVDKARPYAAVLRQLTLAIRIENEENRDEQRRLARDAARLQPGEFVRVFWMAMLSADYRMAADVGQEVSFDLPRGRSDWQIEGFETSKYQAIEKRADVAGARAYALAAIGNAAAARATIADAEADLVEVMAPLPPLAPGEKYGKKRLAEYDRRTDAGRVATSKLEHWKALIELRGRVGTLTIETLRPALDPKQAETLLALPDLLAHIKIDKPADAEMRDGVIKMLRAQVAAMTAKQNKLTVGEVIGLLPRPETAAMVPAFQPTGDGYFLSDMNGVYTKRESGTDYLNIRYGGYLTSRATIEELVLLAAAQQTRKAGKDSFLIDSRLFVERSLTTYGMYGINYGTSNNGYEARVRIRPVNAAAVPADLEHSRWRLIHVDDVEAALSSIYRRDPVKR